jgi:GDSL-like lipase/acylhydrolase family protein
MKLGRAGGFAALSAVLVAAGFATGHHYSSGQTSLPSPNIASHNVQFDVRTSQFAQMSGTHADVVMLGDSNTEFGEWHELLPQAAILNRGISGDTSAGIKARIAEIARHRPKLVFLLVGVNDLAGGADPAEVKNNIASIISSLGTRTVLLDVLYTTNQALNEKIAVLNSKLHGLAVEHLDLNTEIAPNQILLPQYTRDGVHLSGAGYLVWRDKIRALLAGAGIRAGHSATQ